MEKADEGGRVKVNLPEQLKMAWTAGTSARNGLKSFVARAKTISFWVVGILLLVGCITIFIPQLKEETEKEKRAILEQKSKVVQEQQYAPAVPQPQKVLLQLNNTPSEQVRVIGGKCIFFWQETPGTHHTELQLPDKSDWITLGEFRRIGARKAERVRWTGTGTLGYEIRLDGQC